jgi:beta-glucanase (GH16 family)
MHRMTRPSNPANLLCLTALVIAAGGCARNPAARPILAPAAQWTLVWADEFNAAAGTLPDSTRWAADTGASGFGNQELEYYCAPGATKAPCNAALPNAAQDGEGNLVISAIRTPSGVWTSARLKTLGRASVQYGRIEARMRLPTGRGLWPAFWALGTDLGTIGWPASGEIDIMENVAADVPGGLGADVIKATLHGPGYSGGQGMGKEYRFPAGGRVDDGAHVYGVIWSRDSMQFYVDSVASPFLTITPANLPSGAAWAFDKPFFLLLNLAVGGTWPKDPDATTPNPARMVVDYVRVYRREGR